MVAFYNKKEIEFVSDFRRMLLFSLYKFMIISHYLCVCSSFWIFLNLSHNKCAVIFFFPFPRMDQKMSCCENPVSWFGGRMGGQFQQYSQYNLNNNSQMFMAETRRFRPEIWCPGAPKLLIISIFCKSKSKFDLILREDLTLNS